MLGVAAFFWLNSENTGQIQAPKPKEAIEPAPEYKDYDGQFTSFRYLGKYTFQDLPAKGDDLEVKKFTANTVYDKNISFVVSKLPEGKLENNSSFLLRQARSDLYQKRQITYKGRPLNVWVKIDGTEQTVFITDTNRVAILAFTQDEGATIPELTPEVDNLIQSFEWK